MAELTEEVSLVDVTDPEPRAALAGRIFRELGPPQSVWSLPDWVQARRRWPNGRFYMLIGESQGRLAWYQPWFAYPFRLRVRLGPAPLWTAHVVRADARSFHALVDADEGLSMCRLQHALSILRRALPAGAVLFVESVPEGSAVTRAFALSAAAYSGYRALRYGPPNMHRSACIEGGLDTYLGRLGSKTRADVRRTRRRFEAAHGVHSELFVARSEADVGKLAEAVLEVASKTWQFQQEGAGPRDRSALQDELHAAARAGVLRSYVLYAEGRPIAFQIGYIDGSVFDAHAIGYDPAWRKSQPGILLHAAIVDDLGNHLPEITRFDFGLTDRLHKSRLSTDAMEEGFYYLFPKSIRGNLLYGALKASMTLTDALKSARDSMWHRRQRRSCPS
mgnify:CR=1 FL=1